MALREALGSAWKDLPAPLQQFHDTAVPTTWHGEARVERNGSLARLLCDLGGFPKAAERVPLSLSISQDGAGEVWERQFGTQILRSRLTRTGKRCVSEAGFGPFRVIMRPWVDAVTLRMPVVGMRAFGLPLPVALMPGAGGVEGVTEDGRVTFDVSVRLLGLGTLLRYSGWLAPEA